MNSKLDYDSLVPVARVGPDEPGYRKIGLARSLMVVVGACLAIVGVLWFLTGGFGFMGDWK